MAQHLRKMLQQHITKMGVLATYFGYFEVRKKRDQGGQSNNSLSEAWLVVIDPVKHFAWKNVSLPRELTLKVNFAKVPKRSFQNNSKLVKIHITQHQESGNYQKNLVKSVLNRRKYLASLRLEIMPDWGKSRSEAKRNIRQTLFRRPTVTFPAQKTF